jgi:hypothetical protein
MEFESGSSNISLNVQNVRIEIPLIKFYCIDWSVFLARKEEIQTKRRRDEGYLRESEWRWSKLERQ